MANEISQVKLPNNDIVTIKDTTARTAAQQAQSTADSKISSSLKGVANGVAELDANCLVPSSQLPSYVDDVLEYASKSAFPSTGETGKIYVDLATNLTYRWSGSAYVEISPSLALGETSSTAYRGDRGKTAYDHATESGKVSSATAVGLYKVGSTAQGHISGLTAVTKSDITALGIRALDNNTFDTISVTDLTAGDVVVTGVGRFTNGLYGNLTGNADTATNVAWSGVTGKPSTYTPASGSTYYVQNHTDASWATSTSGSWVSMVNSDSTGNPTLPTSGKWWQVLSLDCWNSAPNNWVSQLALPTSDSKTNVWYRTNPSAGTSIESGTWIKILDEKNYNDYAPTKTGTGASGTWGISVSGNAATATKATQDGNGNVITSSYTPYKGNMSTAIGQNTPAAATKTYWENNTNIPTTSVNTAYNTSGTEYTLLFSKGSTNNYGSILRWGYSTPYLEILRRYQGNWQSTDWEKIYAGYADTAGSATKATQDGSGNVITSTYLPLAGGTVTGMTTFNKTIHSDGGQHLYGGGATNSIWYKITLATNGLTPPSSQQWYMCSLSLDIGGDYNSGAKGRIELSYYIHWSGSAFAATNVYGFASGANMENVEVYYKLTEPFIIYVKTLNQYSSLWVRNVTYRDSAYTFRTLETKVETSSAITVENYTVIPISRLYTSNGTYLTTNSSLVPKTNNELYLGSSNSKWSYVYATKFIGALQGNADTASKLGSSNVGSATQPIYLSAGTATACTYTLGKSVPSDALFTDTKNTAGSTDTSSKIFLIGATSQAANPQTYSDDQVYVTSGTLQTNVLNASAGINANTANSGTAGGLALWSNDPTNYGIAMRNTSTQGKFGGVQSDYAIYNIMHDNGTHRGWIWRRREGSTFTNVASIDCVGNAVFGGYVGIGGNATNTSGVRAQYNSTTKSLDFVFVS